MILPVHHHSTLYEFANYAASVSMGGRSHVLHTRYHRGFVNDCPMWVTSVVCQPSCLPPQLTPLPRVVVLVVWCCTIILNRVLSLATQRLSYLYCVEIFEA